jgi:hypothetical protein
MDFATRAVEMERKIYIGGAFGSTTITKLPSLDSQIDFDFGATVYVGGVFASISRTVLPALPDMNEGGEICEGLQFQSPADHLLRSSLLPNHWLLAGSWSAPENYPKG